MMRVGMLDHHIYLMIWTLLFHQFSRFHQRPLAPRLHQLRLLLCSVLPLLITQRVGEAVIWGIPFANYTETNKIATYVVIGIEFVPCRILEAVKIIVNLFKHNVFLEKRFNLNIAFWHGVGTEIRWWYSTIDIKRFYYFSCWSRFLYTLHYNI